MSGNSNTNSSNNQRINPISRALWEPRALPPNIPTEELQQQQQQQQIEKKKKNRKSRGNRKLQRYKAKLRKQGLNNETITTLINNYNNNNNDTDQGQSNVSDINVELLAPALPNQEMLENKTIATKTNSIKRKRATRPTGVTTSMSQMSLSNLLPNKRQRSTTMGNIIEEKKSNDSRSEKKPKYLKVPDQIFKDMLSKSLEGAENIVQLLDTPEKLTFIRTYAHLLNNVFYLRLEQDFWEHYFNVCMTESVWSSFMENNMTKENNLCRLKFKTKPQLEKHRQLILHRLREADNKLNQHQQQQPPLDRSMDMHRWSTVIPAFVRRGQHKLSIEFERKKQLLKFDANDHQLVKTFYNLKPTENQIRLAKIIWQATKDKLQAEEEVAILKQRIYTKRLPSSFGILDHSIDTIENMLQQPALNQDKRATLSFRRLKTIAQFKYDMMIIAITTVEETVRSHNSIIANEKKKLIDSAGGQSTSSQKQIIGFRRRSDGNKHDWCRRSNAMNDTFSHILPSSAIIEVACSLSSKQLSYLTNGPKYVPPCQCRFTHQTIDTIIQRQYDSLFQCFKTSFTKNCMSYSSQQATKFFTAMKNLLHQLYTTPLPPKLFARAKYEHRMIRRIQCQIKQSNVVVRSTDKSKVLHLGSAHDYYQKTLQYMQETNAYKQITSDHNLCQEHVQKVLALIDPMLKNGDINLTLWKQYMRPNVKTAELAHLYTLPKPHKIDTPIRPIVSSIKAAATGVSHFLDLLLRPIFNQVAKATTFINNIHFVRQLEKYRDSGRFLSTTLFVTFDVTNLYTMIPRDGAIFALQKFLYQHAENRLINGMTIDTITRLARLVLDTNCFVYENNYYQQIRGGAMGSPFTMTLANIYMLEWEQSLIEHQNIHNELYGRYIDDVFMTTNSLNKLNIELNRIEKRDENIRITRSIGSTVEFLDVFVENNHGQLKTSVFHKPAAQPYILPFLSDHPRHIHRSTVKAQLLRAARLTSHFDDFAKERLNIEFTLLLNGYPPKFISYYFKQFFQTNNVLSLMEQLDEVIYSKLHQQLLLQSTRREKQQQNMPLNVHQPQNSDKKEIRVYFTFESGPMLNFNRELKQLWKEHYIDNQSVKHNVHLKIGTKSNKNLNQLFVKKKPPRAMLTNVISENTTTTTTTTTTTSATINK